ncbi:MAG TPA: response regulator transcription factor [Ideonella sp.]|uniref:response regulator transcription factor n=2 Tax=Ideonella sp. TaxID=1929293 RepID=UPI002C2ADC14|nr:response regulator transcription factor [Ideonella sp.]HSI49708.1 response regulator transcription factor [Ideonella sp.]
MHDIPPCAAGDDTMMASPPTAALAEFPAGALSLGATPPPRVLVVDDDADMRQMLDDALHRSGFEVDCVDGAAQMREAMARHRHDLVLMDLRLRNEDGLVLAHRLRQVSRVPIVMISGSSDETDRVLLLELAADDFLIKPFGMRELVARVRAVLRRYEQAGAPAVAAPAQVQAPSSSPRLAFGDWVLDLGRRELRSRAGVLCALTQGEYRLLETLARQPQRLWSRDELLEQTRSADTEVYDRSIDVLILRLRRKIEPNPRHPQFICTERGLGYLFQAPVTLL